jgi:LysM repeat protein
LFFYSVVVKIYRLYLYAVKMMGISRFGRRINSSFVVNQKIIHFIVVGLTLCILTVNLTGKAKAQSRVSQPEDVIIAGLIQNEFNSHEQEELIEEYFDSGSLAGSQQRRYYDGLALGDDLVAGFGVGDDGISDDLATIQEGSAVVKPDITWTENTKLPRTEIVNHEVLNGETISTIAQDYGISVNTILWENNLTAYSLIRPGDKLVILPVSGVRYKVASGDNVTKIASRYDISESELLAINNLADSSQLKIGQQLLLPGARKLVSSTVASASSKKVAYSGISAIKSVIAPKGADPVSGNMMNWPTVRRRITQYYSWKHTGLDVADKVGTALYSADAGVVEYVGWGTGYGNQIVVDHGGGKKTRYAHLSAFYVKKGNKVAKGETIGAMGSTGWSTGSHIHFEVIINGKKYNPLNYVK